MKPVIRVFLVFCVATLATPTNSEAISSQPGWSPVIVATGNYRQQLQATPIEYRPNRPLHIYGNTVRRRHHQGNYLPAPRRVLPFSVYRGR